MLFMPGTPKLYILGLTTAVLASDTKMPGNEKLSPKAPILGARATAQPEHGYNTVLLFNEPAPHG